MLDPKNVLPFPDLLIVSPAYAAGVSSGWVLDAPDPEWNDPEWSCCKTCQGDRLIKLKVVF